VTKSADWGRIWLPKLGAFILGNVVKNSKEDATYTIFYFFAFFTMSSQL
jgi:hypothetical protein